MWGQHRDPDPAAFYLNAVPDPGSQINADLDPDPSQTFKKLILYMKNILIVGNWSKNMLTVVQSPVERKDTRFLGKLWSISMLLDPDRASPRLTQDPYP